MVHSESIQSAYTKKIKLKSIEMSQKPYIMIIMEREAHMKLKLSKCIPLLNQF